MVLRKVVVIIVDSKYELYALLFEITIITIMGSIFFTCFCKYMKWGSGKKWMFLTTNQGKVKE